MRILPVLLSAAFVTGVATAVIAQTAPVQTNPNTKVYAYHKAAPGKSKANEAIQQQRAEETPAHGSAKWWQNQNRYSGGGGDGGQ